MPTFDSAGVQIHYEVFGEGKPIVLVHGFASSLRENWVAPGWIETLTPLRQVIALDCRGHGESEKPKNPASYGDEDMGGDVIRLMDHLRIDRADLFGYSIGGRISLGLMVNFPERFTSAVLGGVGGGLARHRTGGKDSPIVHALLTGDRSEATEPVAKGVRTFAGRGGNDLKLRAGVRSAQRRPLDETLAWLSMPVLFVNGANDKPVGDPRPIADLLPNSRVVFIPDRDHFTVVGDQRFKDAVVAFLSEA